MGGKEIKSFRSSAPARLAPGKTAGVYTAFELFCLREEFARAVEQHARATRVMRVAAAVFFFGIILCFAAAAGGVASPLPLLFMIPGLLMIPVATLRTCGVKLCCPACQHNLEAKGFGGFCPGCGGVLKFGRVMRAPECTGCGLKPRHGKGGRRFRIRACTYCGVRLHERGI